jgi:hypothetical protein
LLRNPGAVERGWHQRHPKADGINPHRCDRGSRGFYYSVERHYPGATNFYDYHFAADGNSSSARLPDIVEPICEAGKTADPVSQALYDTVNDLWKEHAVMIPVAHGASATAFRSVEGAHASPLGNEVFSVMNTGTDTLVGCRM